MNRDLIYSYLMLFVVVLDSIFTIHIGKEANPLLLFIMNIFNLSIVKMMIYRTLGLSCLIWFIYKYSRKCMKYVLFSYIFLYYFFILVI